MEVVAETSRRRTRVGKDEESAVSSAEENMALARHLMEARVEGDLDALDEMLAPDFVTHTKLVPGQPPGGKGMTNKIIMIHRIEVGKIAEEWGLGTLGLKLRGVRLEQEWRERECVDQELRVARRIQQASLPKTVPTLEGWRISPFYQPAREVGGDFYDFHLLSEGRVGLVVGDATGKGVPAALVSPTATSSTPMSRLAGCEAPTGRLSVVSPR